MLSSTSVHPKLVENLVGLLKERLPIDTQKNVLFPDDAFYVNHSAGQLANLHYKAAEIFGFLRIEPSDCIIDFCDERDLQSNFSSDAAGIYMRKIDAKGKLREIIFINSKHKDNAFAVGAILAHEVMHLYLNRLNIVREDRLENELLTDLATIYAGLPILILNGMSRHTHMWKTIIMALLRTVYWQEEKASFGYFRPDEYGKYSFDHLKSKNIQVNDFIGYLVPESRYFVPHGQFLFVPHGAFVKGRPSTALIQAMEKKQRLSILTNGSVLAFVVIALFAWLGFSEKDKYDLRDNVASCKEEVQSLASEVDADATKLKTMNQEFAIRKQAGDMEGYNSLVDPHNSLLGKVKQKNSEYEAKRTACNKLIDKLNDLER